MGWINSDDILYPDCVERIVSAYLGAPDAALFHCSTIDIISESGDKTGVMHVPLVSREHLLRHRNTLIQPGSFYRRTALEQVDYFDIGLRYSMDLDLWLRLLSVGTSVDVSSTPIAAYRDWGGTKTATGGNTLLAERIEMLVRHGGDKTDRVQRQARFQMKKNRVKKIYRMVTDWVGTRSKA